MVFVDGEAYEASINSKAAIFSLVVKRNRYSQFNNWPAILRLNPLGAFYPVTCSWLRRTEDTLAMSNNQNINLAGVIAVFAEMMMEPCD